MKRILLLMLVLVFLSGMVFSQSITVNDPHSGDTWYKTNSYTITWTKTGDQHARVKIRLYDPTGTDKILNIVNDTANDGSFPWAIPGSVAAGRYVVRVKTLDNEYYDDSDVFEIKDATSFVNRPQPDVRLAQDLEIRGIRYVFHKGGWIVATVMSNANHFKGDVNFRVVINGRVHSTTVKLDISKGRTTDVYVRQYKRADFPQEGLRVRIDVDFDNKIRETNESENSNSMSKRITNYDIFFFSNPGNSYKLRRLFGRGAKDYRFEFDIKIKHSHAKNLQNIKIKMGLKHIERMHVDGYLHTKEYDIHIPQISSGQVYSRHIKLFFGKTSRNFMAGRLLVKNFLALTKGATYVCIIIIDPDNEFMEINEMNNTSSFTFRVNR